MYALYSKGFGKKAVDLNKKEFYDGKAGAFKVTAKGKTADGVEYEGNVSQGHDAKITLPITKELTASLKEEGGTKTELTAAYKVSDALKVTALLNMDSKKGEAKKVTIDTEFVDPNFSVEGKIVAFDALDGVPCEKKESAMFTNTTGASAAIAFPVPGIDGVSFGLQPAVGFKTDGAMAFTAPLSLGYAGKDFQLALSSGLATNYAKEGGYLSTGVGFKGFFKKSSDLSFAFEVDSVNIELNKAVFDTSKDKNKASGARAAAVTAKFGVEQKWSDTATVKAKATIAGDSTTYDLSYKCCATSLGVNTDGKTFSYGLVYTLE